MATILFAIVIALSLLFFQQISLVGFAANLLAIPLVTLLVVPLAMLGVLLPTLLGPGDFREPRLNLRHPVASRKAQGTWQDPDTEITMRELPGSSAGAASRAKASTVEPASTATYCLPSIMKVEAAATAPLPGARRLPRPRSASSSHRKLPEG